MGLEYDPWHHAEELGLTIQEVRLPARRRGEYVHADRLILLAPRMGHREARCTLAHEIQHAIAGDLPTPFGPAHMRQERLATKRAAALLIDVDEYVAAERLRDGHGPSIAHDLDVTFKTLGDWRYYVAKDSPSASIALRAIVRSACW